jgi:hypothetical protein
MKSNPQLQINHILRNKVNMCKNFGQNSDKVSFHTPKLKSHIVFNGYVKCKHDIREVWLIAYPQT